MRSTIAAFVVVAGVVGTTALGVDGASASTYTGIWTNSSGWEGNCHGYQRVIEGYNGSAHEYQEGEVVAVNGAHCQMQIEQWTTSGQFVNSSALESVSTDTFTSPLYDGPGYHDQVCVIVVAAPASEQTGPNSGFWCSPWY